MTSESNHAASMFMGLFEVGEAGEAGVGPEKLAKAGMGPCYVPDALDPAHDRPDPDDHEALRLEREGALVGAALLVPAVADLLLAELDPREFVDSVSQAVLVALREVRDGDPVHYNTEPTLRLVADLAGPSLEDLGGRQAVVELVADRPALREALRELRAAVARIASVEDEPLVQLAAVELQAETIPRDSTPSPAPVTRCRHRAPSQRSRP